MNSPSRILSALLCACCVAALAKPGAAQTTTPLKFSNNFFVTGDYVVGGWDKASGTITIPDHNAYAPNLAQQVPVGADVVAAFLYWSTVETAASNAGQNG